ncbi:MAG TPA: DUF6624 domain-containing protein [Chitinophagaceae bacterium]|jgi:hypothetical protein|nr:DUF6624 domain-containing protein [Chitinophagaceae bacterium]
MRTAILFFCVSLFVVKARAQTAYTENIDKAWDLYNQKDYINSAKTYSLAFALNGGKGTQTDRYNAACSWALAGNIDSAFHYLFGAAEKNNYDNYGHITTDTDLDSIHGDPRWEKVLAIVFKNKEKAEANFNKPVIAILDTINKDDQRTRKGIVELIQKEGRESDTVKKRLREMSIVDSIDLVKTRKLLDEYGWLGFDEVGRMGALTIFLVIQHSSLPVQQKYLPMMREAVKKNQASSANLALLEDRVALGEGRKQIYGSQIHSDKKTNQPFLAPLDDPDHVDERRKAVGLGSLAEYLKQFGLTWDLELYKKQQKEEDAKVKKN